MEKTSTLGSSIKECLALSRASVYAFLARIYREEISPDFLRELRDPCFIAALSDTGMVLDDYFKDSDEVQLLNELAIEYVRLFIGPGPHISPHESVHVETAGGKLWGPATVEVKHFIETHGFEYQNGYHGLPDHISVELEFMQSAVVCEAQAWRANDKDITEAYHRVQADFIRRHPGRWIPVFSEKVCRESESAFYRQIAELTRNFIEFELAEFSGKKAANMSLPLAVEAMSAQAGSRDVLM